MMYCPACGKEVMQEAVICPGCGCMIKNNTTEHNVNFNINRQQNPYKTNTYAVWSLVLACASFIFGWIITAIVAVILGQSAKTQIEERNEQGKNLADAGIVLGWINIGLSIFSIMLIIIGVGFLAEL
ncbi:MAG: DUF4190 domain-containing protein [Ruminococcaceae bacterium]|nr:DUF4190 domain-containing protein [Oscillospiraceae bacterium]